MKEAVTILIPTRFNSRWIIDLCLKSIRKYTDYPYKIIVGDTGVDEETENFLKSQGDIEVVKCPDPIRPKDYLARIVKTPYFMFLHDDVQILKHGWLNRRVKLMESKPRVGIVGVIGNNYQYGWKRFFNFSRLNKRFFPLVMLLRKEVQDELDLFWGIVKGFDTGGIAYLQFSKQKKWHFLACKFNAEVKHWGQMAWPLKNRTVQEQASLNINTLLEERKAKIELIQNLIKEEKY
jgi:glycosyltransferase involved in cell wall biosynthesis